MIPTLSYTLHNTLYTAVDQSIDPNRKLFLKKNWNEEVVGWIIIQPADEKESL